MLPEITDKQVKYFTIITFSLAAITFTILAITLKHAKTLSTMYAIVYAIGAIVFYNYMDTD